MVLSIRTVASFNAEQQFYAEYSSQVWPSKYGDSQHSQGKSAQFYDECSAQVDVMAEEDQPQPQTQPPTPQPQPQPQTQPQPQP